MYLNNRYIIISVILLIILTVLFSLFIYKKENFFDLPTTEDINFIYTDEKGDINLYPLDKIKSEIKKQMELDVENNNISTDLESKIVQIINQKLVDNYNQNASIL